MSMIEGIGDEVVEVFLFFFIVLSVVVAWESTRVRNGSLSTILRRQWVQYLMFEVRLTDLIDEMISSLRNATNRREIEMNATGHTWVSSELGDASGGRPARTAGSTTAAEQTRQNREVYGSSIPNVRKDQNPNRPHEQPSTSQNGSSNAIKIKLKFSDASVKVSDGNLDETLNEFKRRNFNTELSQGKTVLLIFNGRILENEILTLGAHGLFGDCAVHCMVREPPRLTPRDVLGGSFSRTTPRHFDRPRVGLGGYFLRPPPLRHRDRLWDGLGGSFYRVPPRHPDTPHDDVEGNFASMVLGFLGLLLVGLLYLRFRYSELFTVQTTASLVVLTTLYVAYLVGSNTPGPGTQPLPQQLPQL